MGHQADQSLPGQRRRVLTVAYYFPPLAGGGVQRTLKHVKYLPNHGFDSIVVAGGRRGFFLSDETLRREIPPGTKVLRGRALPLQQAAWKLDGLLRRLGIPTRLVNELLWPDGFVGWLPSALVQALRAIEKYKPDVLYSTSMPGTAHLAALIVHRMTGLPWVADFRDGWTLDPLGGEAPAPLARARAALERTVVDEAAYVTVVDESVSLLDLSPDDSRRVVIRNGVDPDDLALNTCPDLEPSSERFRLSYVGSFYGQRDAAPVFAAVRELISAGKLDPHRFELRIVGHASLNGTSVDSLPVTFIDYVDHPEALAEMARASALLFYQPAQTRGSSGKIYEYLVSGRNVLCVAHPDNLAYRLVAEMGAGECADARDTLAVATALERLLDRWKRGDSLALDGSVRERTLERFSRRTLAAQLADVLELAIAEPPRSARSRSGGG